MLNLDRWLAGLFLSTLSLRRATTRPRYYPMGGNISIHALLAESDEGAVDWHKMRSISIHALLAESDVLVWCSCGGVSAFLSTLSLRRATQWRRSVKLFRQFLSTLSLRRATLMPLIRFSPGTFLSTLSLRRATPSVMQEIAQQRISIHALLAESDRHPKMSDHPHNTFLSTLSLRRATTWARGSRVTYVEFLSTLSLRRATGGDV